jgi:hypothetical protein
LFRDHPIAKILFAPMAMGEYPEAREEGWQAAEFRFGTPHGV